MQLRMKIEDAWGRLLPFLVFKNIFLYKKLGSRMYSVIIMIFSHYLLLFSKVLVQWEKGAYSILNVIWFVTLIKCCGSYLVRYIYIYSLLLSVFQDASNHSSTYPFYQRPLSPSAFGFYAISWVLFDFEFFHHILWEFLISSFLCLKTRSDTRLPQSRAGGQGQW